MLRYAAAFCSWLLRHFFFSDMLLTRATLATPCLSPDSIHIVYDIVTMLLLPPLAATFRYFLCCYAIATPLR